MEKTDQKLIVIDNLTKRFAPTLHPALQNITASVSQGKIIGLAGPDGAGKTTLIRLLAGLLIPTSGTITLAGYDSVKDATQIQHIIGYMPQKFGLYEDLTVMQNLSLYADLRGVPRNEQQETFKRLLTFTSLTPFTSRLAGALSGGMKQKLGLACALIKKPTILLLDEPSVGVDPISRRELWRMVHGLLEEGISVVWSTAYLDEAERCDEVLLLNEGKALFSGPPAELTSRVEGRCFLLEGITENRREVLKKVLEQPNVIDGTIQGSNVRLVTKDKGTIISLEALPQGNKLSLVPVAPRFEDAFIDILGGGPGGDSPLSETIPPIQSKQQYMIEADNLTKKFGSFAAATNITFKVPKGQIFGLLGPNGAGKSTTFKMLCGLLKPTSGKSYVNGLDLQVAPSQGRAQVGYMAQKFSLYGNLSVEQNLNFFSGIYNLQNKEKREAIEKMIEIFNFKGYLDTNAEAIPLGFKQRLALACSVMHHPQVLFLDEPTSGVDPIIRREFWNHINGLVEKGITIMVTTHFMDEAEYCDKIALVYRSQVIKIGTPDSLKADAKTAENPQPTLEDAFIRLIEQYDAEHAL